MSTTLHSRRSVAGLALCALIVSACTPSIAPGTTLTTDPFPGNPPRPAVATSAAADRPSSTNPTVNTALVGPYPGRGSSVVRVTIAPDATLPDLLLRDFEDTTGFTVDVLTGSEEAGVNAADILVGYDGGAMLRLGPSLIPETPAGFEPPAHHRIALVPGALPYAQDDVCVMADTQWYAANRLSPPASVADLSAPDNAARLIVPSPKESAAGASFAHLVASAQGGQMDAWLTTMKAAGMQVLPLNEAEAAWTLNGGGRPLAVAPLSRAARAVTNTGTESYLAPVAGSCVSRTLYAAQRGAATNPEGAHSFMAYLYTRPAQALLAAQGGAFPLDTEQTAHTVTALYAAPREDAVALTAEQLQPIPQGW